MLPLRDGAAMLTCDERGELADLVADYLDALHQAALFGPAAAKELRQSEFLLVSLLMRLMQEHRVASFNCHGHRFALVRTGEQRVLRVARVHRPGPCVNRMASTRTEYQLVGRYRLP